MFFRTKLIATAALIALATPLHAEWVASWTASPHAPLGTEGPFAAASYDNVTISQILRISEGGDEVRIRLSNRYGTAPLAIGAARLVQIDDAGQEIAATSRMMTFGGEPGAVIPRGSPFVSDAAKVNLPDLARVKIELFLPSDTGPCTCHLTGLDELAVSPPGNHVGQPVEPVGRAQHRAFLSAVEVNSPDAPGTIVAFGDSITDGVGSTPGANRRWPDILAERLQAADLEWAVANAGISGNRVLSPGMGEAALARFDEDVLGAFEAVAREPLDVGRRFARRKAGKAALDDERGAFDDVQAGFEVVLDPDAFGIDDRAAAAPRDRIGDVGKAAAVG